MSSLQEGEPDELTPGYASPLGNLVDASDLASGESGEELLGCSAFRSQRLLCHVTDGRAISALGGGYLRRSFQPRTDLASLSMKDYEDPREPDLLIAKLKDDPFIAAQMRGEPMSVAEIDDEGNPVGPPQPWPRDPHRMN
jgi:hypothetical protein